MYLSDDTLEVNFLNIENVGNDGTDKSHGERPDLEGG